jgi:prefoldin subunit 5
MEREVVIERLDVLERVVSQLFSEIVMLRSAVKSFQPVDETDEDVDEDGELNEEELREAVKSGQITGFIGVMKNFE